MNPCQLITGLCQHAVFRMNAEDRYSVRFQAFACIQEFTIRADVDIPASFGSCCVSSYCLDFF